MKGFQDKEEDASYALSIRRNVERQEALERERKEKQRQDMQRYKEILEKQIDDTNKKKLFKDVMSEYERKVNGNDLASYENMDLHLHSKVVGTKDGNEAKSNVPSPEIKKPTEHLYSREAAPSADYNLARRINMVDNVMKKDNSYIQNPLTYNSSPRIVKMAMQNMLDPRVRYMRNNTQNRIYGYNGEDWFRHESTNKSMMLKPSTLASRDQPGMQKGNALTIAGRSQIMDQPKYNPHVQNMTEDYSNLQGMKEMNHGNLQDIYARRQADRKSVV